MKNICFFCIILLSFRAHSEVGDFENHIFGLFNITSEMQINTTIDGNNGLTDNITLDQVAPGVGVGYEMGYQVSSLYFGDEERPVVLSLGLYYEIQRDINSRTEVTSSTTTVTNNRNEQTQLTSIIANAQIEPFEGFRLFGGASFNMVTLENDLNATWDVSNVVGGQAGLSYTFNNFRGQAMYRYINGNIRKTSTFFNQNNLTGTYDLSNITLTIGFVF